MITVSPGFKPFLSFPVHINDEALASIAPTPIAMMEMATREALGCRRAEGAAAPVRIT